MSKEVIAHMDLSTFEFMLDLPEDVKVLSAEVIKDDVILKITVEDDHTPDEIILDYAHDDYGTMALVAMTPIEGE